ncbi:MAG: thioesterase [Flavobacteriales bacterium]|nr:thioesterase [Flavobacteriales bacterium]
MSKVKLFCLPYAGGSATIYNNWTRFLGPGVELIPIELAGRGRRSGDPLYQDVPEAVDDIYAKVVNQILDGQPYAFFGHSMGAMLAYEVIQKIKRNHLPEPIHAFFSGRGAPHLKSNREKMYHELNNDDFKKEIMNLGGTPKEFFDYPELLDYLLPILKNDFKISETNVLNEKITPLNCEITAFIGKEEDQIQPENAQGWMHHTSKLCSIYFFNGGHFFINDQYEKMTDIISKQLVSKAKFQRVL